MAGVRAAIQLPVDGTGKKVDSFSYDLADGIGTRYVNTFVVCDSNGNVVTTLGDGLGNTGLGMSMIATNYVVSTVNSTTAQLAAAATFTGGIETIFNQQAISMLLTSDQTGLLTVNQYIDAAGTRLISSWPYTIAAGVPFSRSFVGNGNYFNLTFKNNGASTTTTLNINTAYGTLPAATNLGNAPVSINEINGVATASTTGALHIQGYQPAATTFASVTATGAQATVAANDFNVVTLTLRTFTGTSPSITYKLQVSDDGTNWVDLQGINNSSGLVGVSWTQAAALVAGTAGPSIDYTIGAYTSVRINVTAISGTSATAAFGLASQSMPYEAAPGAIAQGTVAAGVAVAGSPVRVGGSDGTLTQDINVTSKAVQGTRGLAVQNLKDAGRSSVMITAAVASTSAAETLIAVSKSRGLATTTSASSNTITSGTRFRIQAILASVRNSTGTTASNVTMAIRAAVGAATTTSSPLQFQSVVALPASTVTTLFPNMLIADGFEIDSNSATNTWGVTITHPQWVTGSVVATFNICIIGYEY